LPSWNGVDPTGELSGGQVRAATFLDVSAYPAVHPARPRRCVSRCWSAIPASS